jgi:hypothetical protein
MQSKLPICELYELHAQKHCEVTMTMALDAHFMLAMYSSIAFL